MNTPCTFGSRRTLSLRVSLALSLVVTSLQITVGCASQRVVVPADATCWQLLELGRERIEASEFDEALEILGSAENRFPDCKEAHAAVGHALVGKQQYAKAIEEYSRAITIDRDYEGAYVGRAWTRWFVGDLDAAADDYRTVIRLDPEDLSYYTELERVLFDLGRPMEVADLWADALRRSPSWTNAKYWRVVALERAERWDLLRVEVPELLAMDKFKEFPHLHYLLGRALDERRDYAHATPSLRRAFELVGASKVKDASSLQLYGDELIFSQIWNGDRAGAQRSQKELESKLTQAGRHESGK